MNKNYLPIITPIILFLTGLGFLGYSYYKSTSQNPASLSVSNKYKEAIVEVNGKEIGKTPLTEYSLKPGTAEITIKNQFNQIKKEVNLTPGAETVITGDLGTSEPFSSNMVLWYDKSNNADEKIFISSTPQKAKVSINGNYIGETPLTKSRKEILENENNQYNINIEKEGYETMIVAVSLAKGFTLNITSKLFLKPIPKVTKKADSTPTYEVYVFAGPYLKRTNPAQWATALAYWLDTRGTTTIGGTSINYFDYFIDTEGTLYNGKGDILNKEKVKITEKPKEPLKIAFLDTENEDSSGLTKKAEETLKNLTQEQGDTETKTENTYEVTDTGVGYLNVRKSPSVGGELLGKLNIGEKVEVIEKQGDWYKIKYKEGEAWVFGSYLRKIENTKPEEN